MKIDHVGIAVPDIEKAIDFYRKSFHLTVTHREEVASQHVKVAFLGDSEGAETQIELLEPIGESGAVARFLASKGPGMHHLAFHSPDIGKDMARLRSEGRPPLEEKARPGARGHSVCFLHPKHAEGVLVELVG